MIPRDDLDGWLFRTAAGRTVLLRELYEDAPNPASSHDFGRDILLGLVRPRPSTERKPSARWRTFQSAACSFQGEFSSRA
jgi:hypothetical protein